MNVLEGKLTAKGMKVAIVVARFNEFITSKLMGGASAPSLSQSRACHLAPKCGYACQLPPSGRGCARALCSLL